MRMKIFAALAAGIALFFSGAFTAWAHATPLSYEPEATGMLMEAPARVRIHFSERVEPKTSGIAVYGPDGSRADNGDAAADPQDSHYFGASLKNAGEGTYSVSWHVTSADDGHFTQGGYSFSVGMDMGGGAERPQSAGNFEIEHNSGLAESVTIGLELLGESWLLGLLAVLVFVWRPMRKKYFAEELAREDGKVLKRAGRLLWAAFALAALGGVLYLGLKADELRQFQNTGFWPALAAFLSTVSARYTLYRLAGTAIFCALLQRSAKKILASEKPEPAEIILFALLALAALARARVSHAAASEFHPAVSVFINAAHLYFKDLWIGGVMAFCLVIFPSALKRSNAKIASFAAASFSKITAIALAAGGISGVYIIWLHLKSLSNILVSGWGQKFALLGIFAALLFAARMASQLFAQARAAKAEAAGQGKEAFGALSKLNVILPFEAAAGVFVIMVTASLIITTPPVAGHSNFKKQAGSQGASITLTQHPYEDSKLLISITEPGQAESEDISGVTVTLANPEKNLGPVTAQAEERFPGGYVFDRQLLSAPGDWNIGVTASRPGKYDLAASFALKYPDELDFAQAHARDRTFDGFAAACLGMAVVIAACSALLYRHAEKLRRKAGAGEACAAAGGAKPRQARWAWPASIAACAAVLYAGAGIPGIAGGAMLRSNFQRLCERNSAATFFAWHESVPERAGQATSDTAVPGCMTGNGEGQYHFGDEREFLYFTRPAEARTALRTSPETIKAGQPAILTFTIQDYSGQPVRELNYDHDRILHVIIASRDFTVFSHIHPEDFAPVTSDMISQAQFTVNYTFPKAGKYLVSADYTVRAEPFASQFYVTVGGSPEQGTDAHDFSLRKAFDGYDISLKTWPGSIRAGQPAVLSYHIERDGRPVTDLNPYLGVPMHLSIIKDDLLKYLHIHGFLPLSWTDELAGKNPHLQHLSVPAAFGPDIQAIATFPVPGIYHIFGEIRHGDKVIATQFTVTVQ